MGLFDNPLNPPKATPLDVIPFVSLPYRALGAVMGAFSGPAGGQKATLGGKPVVYNSATGKWDPDLSTEEGQNKWRKPGTTAYQNDKPVKWDPQRGWVATPSSSAGDGRRSELQDEGDLFATAPLSGTVPGTIPGAPPAPTLPAPDQSGTTFPDSSRSPLEGQRPDINPNDIFTWNEKMIRDYFIPQREKEQQQELERYAVTAYLRNQGLDRLTDRRIREANIAAWRDLKIAQEQARANRDIALASVIAHTTMPNPNVMAGLNEAMRAAMTPVTVPQVGVFNTTG